jgi:ankyrin repeat protein
LTTLPAVCAAIPSLAAVGFCGAVLGATAFGYTPTFWQGGPLTLAEAAALRDQGEVARLIEAGADPNAEYALRPDVLAVSRATPLEAAVLARRAEVVQLLMREGAVVDERSWHHLHCVAVEIGENDVIGAIDAHRPATAATVSCTQ